MPSFAPPFTSALTPILRVLPLALVCLTLPTAPKAMAGEVVTFGATVGTTSPVLVDTSGVLAGKSITAVSVGESHVLALASDGTVYSWGENNGGALGTTSVPNGGYTSTPVAVDMTGVLAGKHVEAVAAGVDFSLALTTDGRVFSWGSNTFNQLGNGNNTDQLVPVALDMTGALNGRTVIAIAAGDEFALALTSDGAVYSWGYNEFGRLGVDPSVSAASSPVTVDVSGVLAGNTITAIAAGRGFSLALSSDSKVFGWGIDSAGQIGNGSIPGSGFTNSPLATDMSGALSGLTVTSIACGGYHSLALASNGRVYGWGNNQLGQLGDNAYTNQELTPVAVDTGGVLGGVSVAQISTGNQCSFALSASGVAYAWGFNFSSLNQLGLPPVNGSAVLRTDVPTAVDTSGVLNGAIVTALQSGSGGGNAQSTAVVATASVSPPVITVQPANQSVNSGSIAMFSVTATGGALSYQWSFGATPIAGATSSTLSFTATASSAGNYSVVVSNAGGSSTSSPATLAVGVGSSAPDITVQPANQSVSSGATAIFSVTATGSGLSYQWSFGGAAISGATASTLSIVASAANAGSYSVVVSNVGGSVASSPATLTVAASPMAPVITVQPANQSVSSGATAIFSVTATGSGLSYQWSFSGAAISGATASTLSIVASAASAGSYSVVVSNPAGSIASRLATLAIVNTAAIVNVSVRAPAGSGEDTLIVGFSLAGSASKGVLVRGIGPALTAFGVADPLLDPQLTLWDGSATLIGENDAWGGSATLTEAFESTGAFPLPATSKDAAILQVLAPGPYTAQITGSDPVDGTALAEVYDAAVANPASRLVNVSGRAGNVGVGSHSLIAGFAISGSGSCHIVVRGVGPTLAKFGIVSPLPNPVLTVYDSAGKIVATNDDWNGDITLIGDFSSAGAFPLLMASKDAALDLSLAPGNYTAVVSSGDASEGTALVEMYLLK